MALLGLLQEQTFLGGEGGYRISLPIGSGRMGHGEGEQKGKFALDLREGRAKKPNTHTHTKAGGIATCGGVGAKLAGWSWVG